MFTRLKVQNSAKAISTMIWSFSVKVDFGYLFLKISS